MFLLWFLSVIALFSGLTMPDWCAGTGQGLQQRFFVRTRLGCKPPGAGGWCSGA